MLFTQGSVLSANRNLPAWQSGLSPANLDCRNTIRFFSDLSTFALNEVNFVLLNWSSSFRIQGLIHFRKPPALLVRTNKALPVVPDWLLGCLDRKQSNSMIVLQHGNSVCETRESGLCQVVFVRNILSNSIFKDAELCPNKF